MNIYTFDYFWQTFHYHNNTRKVDKQSCLKEWNRCILSHKKKQAIKDIKSNLKFKYSALEYLKTKLK